MAGSDWSQSSVWTFNQNIESRSWTSPKSSRFRLDGLLRVSLTLLIIRSTLLIILKCEIWWFQFVRCEDFIHKFTFSRVKSWKSSVGPTSSDSVALERWYFLFFYILNKIIIYYFLFGADSHFGLLDSNTYEESLLCTFVVPRCSCINWKIQ